MARGGGWGHPIGFGEPGTDFQQRQIMFDREFSDASWEICMWGGRWGWGRQVTAGRQVRTQTRSRQGLQE